MIWSTRGWDLALSQFEPQIKAGTLSIAELATKIRRDVGIEQRIRRLVLAAAVSSTGFKKNCDGNGGKWRELFWTKDHWLEFFSCRNTAGKDVGPLFTIEDGNFKNGQMEFLTASGLVKIKASVAGRYAGMRTQLLFDEKPMGMDTWFSSDGSVLATDEHTGNIPAAYVFDQKGQGVWSSMNATDTTLKMNLGIPTVRLSLLFMSQRMARPRQWSAIIKMGFQNTGYPSVRDVPTVNFCGGILRGKLLASWTMLLGSVLVLGGYTMKMVVMVFVRIIPRIRHMVD